MGLKESKKYQIGSIHENGGGKFEILRRWYDKETDTIMLEYRFLEDNRVEVNKEVNVNASEWKWRRVRGLAGKEAELKEREEEEANRAVAMEGLFEGLNGKLEKHFADQQGILMELLSVVKIQQKQIDQLVKENGIINKLLEKIK